MPQQQDLLREIAAASNSGAPDRISDWFTNDFRLHEPGALALPVGHAGASQMRARFRTLVPPINLDGARRECLVPTTNGRRPGEDEARARGRD